MTPKLLGEMTDAEIGALVRAFKSGKEIEYFNQVGNWGNCGSCPAWDINTAYRIAPEPVRQAAIPWDVFADAIVAVAMDKNGDWYSYDGQPKPSEDRWTSGDAHNFFALRPIKFYRGNEPDWRNTLQMRPGHEGKP